MGLVHLRVGLGGVYLGLKLYLLSNYPHQVAREYSKVGAVEAISRPFDQARSPLFSRSSNISVIRSVSAFWPRSRHGILSLGWTLGLDQLVALGGRSLDLDVKGQTCQQTTPHCQSVVEMVAGKGVGVEEERFSGELGVVLSSESSPVRRPAPEQTAMPLVRDPRS